MVDLHGGYVMGKPEHRRAAGRRGLRCPGGMKDSGWTLIAPPIPPARRGGRPRDVNLREILNATFDGLATGCQRRALPNDLSPPPAIPLGFAKRNLWPASPKSTAHFYFMLWEWDGTLERIHAALDIAVREAAGREASPTAAIIGSQTAKAARGRCRRLENRVRQTL